MDVLTDLQAETAHTIHHTILDQISEAIADTQSATKINTTDKLTTGTSIETEATNRTHNTTRNNSFQNRYDNNHDRNRFDNRRRKTKYKHYRNQSRTQVIFKYTEQNPLELMQTVRNFVNFMKVNPSSRELFKTNKIALCSFHNEVSKSEIHASNLQQVQQLINEDTDLVFNALVAADYIDEIECLDGSSQQNA